MAQTVDRHGVVWELEASRRGLHIRRPRWRRLRGDQKDWLDLIPMPDFDDPFGFLFALVLFFGLAALVLPLLFFTAELLVITVPVALAAGVLSLLGRVSVAGMAAGQPVLSETRWGLRSESRARAAVIARIAQR